MEEAVDTNLVIEVTRATIKQVAPNEMILFPSISEEYARDPERILKQQGLSDQPGSFGIDPLAEHVTIFCMYLIHQAIAHHLLQTAADEVTSNAVDILEKGIWNRLKRFFKRKSTQPTPKVQKNMQEFTPEMLDQIYEIAKNKAPEFHVPKAKADQLAKVIIAELILARNKQIQGGF